MVPRRVQIVRCVGTPWKGALWLTRLAQKHRQECHYRLPQKRQASKKSVESASLEKSRNSRSQLDEPGIIVDTLVTAANGAQLSPALGLHPSRTVNSLNHGPHHTSQANPVGDDQCTVGTLPDDILWNIDAEPYSAQNLPSHPSTGISNMPDSNHFSWPPFMTDADWQFGHDVPLTAEPPGTSACTSSAALSELDITYLCNRPPQGFDPAACAGELIENLSKTPELELEKMAVDELST
ncbi:MAG: hypothetical protein LQ340_000808 [Diploschistes diacapsis]|nr:MAG: hypothetical protein LQ340_000808 [Diploschistes diacapsis]